MYKVILNNGAEFIISQANFNKLEPLMAANSVKPLIVKSGANSKLAIKVDAILAVYPMA